MLLKYKNVDSGGSYKNNVSGKIKIKWNFWQNMNFQKFLKILKNLDWDRNIIRSF